MSATIPPKVPACAVALLARSEWFAPDPLVVARARLASANWIARLLTHKRFSGTDRIYAITLGGTIYIRMEDHYDPHTPTGLALLAHELKHVQQYERESVPQFLVKYLWSYTTAGGYGKTVRFEDEAYCFQQAVESHLAREFADNSGINPCVEMGDPHTPNPAFVKRAAVVFNYSV